MGYIDDLKELVPAYVIAAVSGVAALIEGVTVISPNDAAIAVWILMGISIAVVAFIEGTSKVKKPPNTLKPLKTIISCVNAGLWIITVNLYILNFSAVFEFWFRLTAALWTGFIPIIYNKIKELRGS